MNITIAAGAAARTGWRSNKRLKCTSADEVVPQLLEKKAGQGFLPQVPGSNLEQGIAQRINNLASVY